MVKNRFLRFLLLILGFISLGLGITGIILPILPTTPFLLLTSFCFVKSSVKFNKWFLNSKIYKKYLENFSKNKVMTLKSELILLSIVSAMLLVTMYMVNNLVVTIILSILILIKYSYFIFFVKPVTKEKYLILRGNLDAR